MHYCTGFIVRRFQAVARSGAFLAINMYIISVTKSLPSFCI